MVAGRGHNYKYTNHAQVVDMKSNNTCNNLQNYPIRIISASGGVIGGSPIICGGYGKASGESRYENRKECYVYDKSSQTWKLHAIMNKKRRFSSSVVINGALWVLGGKHRHTLDSTEYIHTNGTVVAGPNLPAPRSGHCSLTLHDGNVMIIGGHSGYHDLKTVLIFSPKNNSFAQGPSMIHERFYFACTLFYSPMHDNRPVVLSAGGSHLTAEVLDYTTANAVWQESKLTWP